MSRGEGGLIAFLGQQVLGGGAASYETGVMYLPNPAPGFSLFEKEIADHELSHMFGNPHSDTLPSYNSSNARNIMDRNPYGTNVPALPAHITRLMEICGLG
jgi:hypothetical protein